MKYALASLCALLLLGCASDRPYDQQFSTMDSVDAYGVRRSHAWVIGPSRAQAAAWEANHGKK
jgi:hypothetical protein